MSDKSGIEWTDATWNPVTGCTKVSPGCDHCYAETFAERFRGVPGHHFEQGFDVVLRPERLALPLTWKRPRRVFVNSMSDLFHDSVPDEFVAKAFAVMALAGQHTFQLLTKRHGRMRSLLNNGGFYEAVSNAATDLIEQRKAAGPTDEGKGSILVTDLRYLWRPAWPLPNLWLGVSVEDQKRAELRIPALLETPAAVRFLSCEPLLGAVDLSSWIGATNGRVPESGERGVPRSGDRRVDGRPTGPRLEGGSPEGEPLDRQCADHPVHATPGRESGGGVPPSSSDVRWSQSSCACSSAGLAPLPRGDRRGPDRQSHERHQDGQPSRESGIGDRQRAADPCTAGAQAGPAESVRRTQFDGEAELRACGGDPGEAFGWDVAESSGSGVRRTGTDGLSDSQRRPQISWVICGGESGRGARPMHPGWARSLRDQCNSAGVAYHFKQWGEYGQLPKDRRDLGITVANDGTVYQPGDLSYPDGPRYGEALRANHGRAHLTAMYRVGKKFAGRELDGRTWDEYPERAA